ncbi:MAG: YggT family protein [Thermodesulfovibrio sp.]
MQLVFGLSANVIVALIVSRLMPAPTKEFQEFVDNITFIMWLVIGGAILSLFKKDMKNPIYSLFLKVTEPLYKVGRKIFPKGTYL